jgi:hypothetical protein
MNNIEKELSRAWQKAQGFPGELKILTPDQLDPAFAASTVVKLLQQTYVSHGITENSDGVEADIKSQKVEPWIVTRDNRPVACAALVHQSDGSVEIGRAVSIENGSGAGKIAMLEAARSKGSAPLVAEIRLADSFAGVPSSEATQRICHGILELAVHAILPPFRHGRHPISGSKYNEMFGFAAEQINLINDSPVQTAQDVLQGRNPAGIPKNIQIVQSTPFKVAILSDSGLNTTDFLKTSRKGEPGCTMVAAEATDQNLASIAWLMGHDFILTGIDRNLGDNGLPILLLATLAHGTMLAPTKASDTLPKQLKADIFQISNQFNHLIERS